MEINWRPRRSSATANRALDVSAPGTNLAGPKFCVACEGVPYASLTLAIAACNGSHAIAVVTRRHDVLPIDNRFLVKAVRVRQYFSWIPPMSWLSDCPILRLSATQ